jgi:hypothetical protein
MPDKHEYLEQNIESISQEIREYGFDKVLIFATDQDSVMMKTHCSEEDLLNFMIAVERKYPRVYEAFIAIKAAEALEQRKADRAVKH